MLETLNALVSDGLVLIAVPLFLLAMVLEAGWSLRKRPGLYDIQDTLSSVSMGALALLVEALPKALAFIGFEILHELSPLRDWVGRSSWAWLALFLLDDFTYYVFHRANHRVRLLWAGHVPHHSSRHLNLGTALRQGVGERFHKFVFWAPLPLLGFDAVMIFTMMSASLVYQFFIHTQVVDRLPAPIEFLFNTPSHHRVHHAANAPYLDRNHGGVLIIWDRLFGTFKAEDKTVPPRYGLAGNVRLHLPWSIATHEYQAILHDLKSCRGLRTAAYCLLGPPSQARKLDPSEQRAGGRPASVGVVD